MVVEVSAGSIWVSIKKQKRYACPSGHSNLSLDLPILPVL
jgi:hypothetical protein